MANSMTGYGRSRRTAENYDIAVEIKSVNHRYADFSIKLPRFCVFLEDNIKKCISKKVSRGKIDVFVTVRKEEDDSKEFTINTAAAKSLIDSLRSLSEDFGLKDDLTLSSVAGFDDIFEVSRAAELVSDATRKMLSEGQLPRPVISSACPAVVRLIRVRFPDLIRHILPLQAPVEVAARLAKKEAMERTGLPAEKIGCIFKCRLAPKKAPSMRWSRFGMSIRRCLAL